MTPRFLTVKYASDLKKMEPRNIGVIAWHPGHAVMRVMGVTENKINVPRFVHTASVYRMWVDAWRKVIERGSLRTWDDRETVSIYDESFLDTLKATARDNYFLCDGGVCIDELSKVELSELADYLYGELVTEPKSIARTTAGEESRLVRKAFREAVKESGLDQQRGYFGDYKLAVKVKRKQLVLDFDAAIHRGNKPTAVYQKVLLLSPDSVLATAAKFGEAIGANQIDRDHCAALVYITPEVSHEPEAMERLEYMEMKGTVINLADDDAGQRMIAMSA